MIGNWGDDSSKRAASSELAEKTKLCDRGILTYSRTRKCVGDLLGKLRREVRSWCCKGGGRWEWKVKWWKAVLGNEGEEFYTR